MPPCLVSRLKVKVTEKYETFKNGMREGLVSVFSRKVKGVIIPGKEALLNTTKWHPLDWDPVVGRCFRQSRENYECQLKLFESAKGAINCLLKVDGPFPRFVFGSGEPGSGKSMVMMLAALYAVSRGCTVIATCIEAERALGLGGLHLHKLLSIPVNDSSGVTRLASQALMKLERLPEQKTLIRELDVLFLDEIGKLGSSMYAVLDIIFRDVRNSRLPMGGVYCMGTIDFWQLQPIRGKPFLTSQHILTSFRFVNMKGNVRYRFDSNMAEMNRIVRTDCPTVSDIATLKNIIINECTHVHKEDVKHVGGDVLRVFGRWTAIYESEDEVYEVAASEGKRIIDLRAKDEQSSALSSTAWVPAERRAINALNKHVKERSILRIFSGLLIEFTQNTDTWVNGQVGIVVDLPTSAELRKADGLLLWLAPVGVSSLPKGSMDKIVLAKYGWVEIRICPYVPIRNVKFGLLLSRRIQYCFRPMIGQTVHRVMGHDVDKLITCVGGGGGGGLSKYLLWERGQIVVILSRTSSCKHISFIGDPIETADEVVRLMLKRGPYDNYMERMVRCFTDGDSDGSRLRVEQGVHLSDLPYRLTDVALPSDDTGFVYLLLNLSDSKRLYIGSTARLRQRLLAHCRGFGSEPTRDSRYGKWALAGFICGFECMKDRYMYVENRWSQMVNDSGGDALGLSTVWDLGIKVIAYIEESNGVAALTAVKCFELNLSN